VVVVIDIQESYRTVAFEFDRVSRAVGRLLDVAALLGVPAIATVQYPKGLGPLIPEVAERLPPGSPVVEKLSLSCIGAPEFGASFDRTGRRQVVVCGLEAHACVNQTVHDLLAQGYPVHVPRDGVSSRFAGDFEIGWQKMIGSGAVPTSVETVALEWIRTAAAPEFKGVQGIIK
jgi:nicotinamidase-related amidase